MFPNRLYTACQCRELDSLAIAGGIAGYELMCRAGAAAFALLLQEWPQVSRLDNTRIHVVCGAGNNGGDGLVVARLAHQQGLPVTVHFLGDEAGLRDEARLAYADAVAAGVGVCAVDTSRRLDEGIIVDALLGIGLQGPVRDTAAAAIDWMNASHLPVLALDIPSGICADTGRVLGAAVHADRTITFIAAKCGLYTGVAPDYTGEIMLAGLELPAVLLGQVGNAIDCLTAEQNLPVLPPRRLTAHKGDFGHVLVIGGNRGMAGAALMAAMAAARCGAGLVSVATLPEHVPAIVSRQPEIMAHGVTNIHELQPLLEKASVVVAGPGLGQTPWAEQMLYQASQSGLPLVLDADALNLLARGRVMQPPFPAQWVLTPHPGEAARLAGSDVETINADRFQAALELQQQYGTTVILKGAGTVVASAEGLALCPYGNPGMASGGMGDVLSGVIGALLAQGLQPGMAARAAVLVHALAADHLALEYGERGLLASDLVPVMRQLLNETGFIDEA